MSDDKLAEIRARHLRDERWRYSPSMLCPQSHDDRAFLLAEIERQARHIEELREKIDAERSCACSFDSAGDVCAAHSPSLTRALAEDARQRAKNERLRAALRWYANPRNHSPVERRYPGDPDPAVVFMEVPPIMSDCGRRARNALKGKP